MSTRLGDLMFRLGADVSGFKDSFRDAVEVLETTGTKATKVGAIISKAFDNVGAGDVSAKLAARAKSLQASFELLEKAYKDGKITAEDFARAQDGLRGSLEKLTDLTPKFDRLGEALRSVKVDGSQFEVSGKIAELRNNLSYLEAAYKAGKLSAEDFARAQKSVGVELEKLAKADFTSGVEKLASQFSSAGQKAQDFGRVLTVGVTAPLVAIATAALKTAGDFQSLDNGLRAVTKEAGPLEAQLARLREVAKLPGLGFREAVQGSINLQAAGFSAGTAERALKAFGNALVTVGKGRQDLDGVILALTQIAAKGKISAQEINQLGERLPQIRVAIKDAFGEGFTDADAFAKAGIGAQEFIDKIIAQFERLPKAAGGFKNDLENLRDSVDQSLAEIGNALLPVASSILQTIEPLVKGIKSAAEGFAALPAPVQTSVIALAGIAAAAGPALYAFGGIARGLGEVTPLLARLATSGAPAGQALGSVSTSAALLTGGLVALGAALAGVALYETFAGAAELSAELAAIYESSNRAADGIVGLGDASKQSAGLIAELLAQAQNAGSYLGDHLWEYVFPPSGLRERFQEVAFAVKQLTGTFPELEAAARRSQATAAASMRAVAEQVTNGLQVAVKKSVENIQAEKAANLQAVKVAEETLKTLKKMQASKDEIAVATERLTAAQRKLHPELRATGDAAGHLGKKYDEARPKAVAFTEAQITALAKLHKARQALMLGIGAEGIWEFQLKTGTFDQQALELDARISQIIMRMHDLRDVSREVQSVLETSFANALVGANSLEAALAGNGVKSATRMQEELKQAAERHAIIEKTVDANGRMIATQNEYDQSLKRVLEAERALALIRGESTAAIDEKLSVVNARLVEHGIHVKGVKDSWLSLSKEVSTIVTNFTQSIAKSLFDGTKDWGAKWTAMWKDLAAAVTATFLTPLTEAITKFINTTIADLLGGKGFGGIKKSLAEIRTAVTGVFGGSPTSVPAVPGNPTGPSTPSAPGAGSSAGGLMGVVNVITGALTAISSIFGNFQMRAMNKSLDIIVKHTLGTQNELSNLRADEWLRETHMMVKLDGLWNTLMSTRDYLGNEIIGALRDISTAVAAGTLAVRDVEAGVDAPLPVLERLISAVNDGATRIVEAIRAGGIGGGSGSGAGENVQLRELQMKLRDLTDAQFLITEQLPAEMVAAMKSGQMPFGVTDEQRPLIRRYSELHDAIVLVSEQIRRLTGGNTEERLPERSSAPAPTYTSAVDPETGTLDPNAVKTTVVAVGGGTSFDASGVIEALGSLHSMIEKGFSQLFEYLSKGSGAARTWEESQSKKTGELITAEERTAGAVEESARLLETSIRSGLQGVGEFAVAYAGDARFREVEELSRMLNMGVEGPSGPPQATLGERISRIIGEGYTDPDTGERMRRDRVLRTDEGEFPWYLGPPTPMQQPPVRNWTETPTPTKTTITYNITGNNFRSRSDIDYLVEELELHHGIRN